MERKDADGRKGGRASEGRVMRKDGRVKQGLGGEDGRVSEERTRGDRGRHGRGVMDE